MPIICGNTIEKDPEEFKEHLAEKTKWIDSRTEWTEDVDRLRSLEEALHPAKVYHSDTSKGEQVAAIFELAEDLYVEAKRLVYHKNASIARVGFMRSLVCQLDEQLEKYQKSED